LVIVNHEVSPAMLALHLSVIDREQVVH
jgi:hypothetical protein